jgi:hypothetical protein
MGDRVAMSVARADQKVAPEIESESDAPLFGDSHF